MAPVISTVIHPVKDLAKARTLYGALPDHGSAAR
jgi:hypothetical protein